MLIPHSPGIAYAAYSLHEQAVGGAGNGSSPYWAARLASPFDFLQLISDAHFSMLIINMFYFNSNNQSFE